jgi:hypothetical protein
VAGSSSSGCSSAFLPFSAGPPFGISSARRSFGSAAGPWPGSARWTTPIKRPTICRRCSDGSSCAPTSSGFSEFSPQMNPCRRLARSPTASPTGSSCTSSRKSLMSGGPCLLTPQRLGGTRQPFLLGRSVLNVGRRSRSWRSDGGPAEGAQLHASLEVVTVVSRSADSSIASATCWSCTPSASG